MQKTPRNPQDSGVLVKAESDVQQIGVDLQSTISVMGQNLLSQDLAQLDTFLVEAV